MHSCPICICPGPRFHSLLKFGCAVKDVYVHQVAVDIGWRQKELSLSEWVFDLCHRVLTSGDLTRDDLGSVVLACHDLIDGRGLSSMLTAGPAGGYLRDEIRVSDDGAAALMLADARVRSGHSDHVIVAAWGRSSEGDQQEINRLLFEPIYTRGFGLTELSVSAMRARLLTVGVDSDLVAAAAARRSGLAAANPRSAGGEGFRPSSPDPILQRDHLPLYADVRAAMVISSLPSDIAIVGIGQGSDRYSPGERDLRRLEPLASAAARAMQDASAAPTDVALWELDGQTLFDEALACEAVGAAPEGKGLDVLATSKSVNQSGGSAAGYCWPAMGLVRAVETVSRLRERAAEDKERNLGVATGSSVLSGQVQTAVVLEKL
jgi:acetyl-CoA C-acetyltransferase